MALNNGGLPLQFLTGGESRATRKKRLRESRRRHGIPTSAYEDELLRKRDKRPLSVAAALDAAESRGLSGDDFIKFAARLAGMDVPQFVQSAHEQGEKLD